jgi:PhnB protein
MQLSPYLFFSGNCAEALAFYAAARLGKTTVVHHYEGSPMESKVPPDWKNKIMHATFVGEGVHLHASDANRPTKIADVSLSLALSDLAEANRLFAALSAGGQVMMPLDKTFWGSHFGMFLDKFGVPWMINCDAAQA